MHGSLYQSFGFPVLLHQAGNEGRPLTSTPARQDRGPPASAIWHQYKDWAYLLEAQFSAFKRNFIIFVIYLNTRYFAHRLGQPDSTDLLRHIGD